MSFSHPIDVPIPEALAIHAIMHNKGDDWDWELLDAWVRRTSIDIVLDKVVEVLVLNGVRVDTLPREREWWGRQLRVTN